NTGGKVTSVGILHCPGKTILPASGKIVTVSYVTGHSVASWYSRYRGGGNSHLVRADAPTDKEVKIIYGKGDYKHWNPMNLAQAINPHAYPILFDEALADGLPGWQTAAF